MLTGSCPTPSSPASNPSRPRSSCSGRTTRARTRSCAQRTATSRPAASTSACPPSRTSHTQGTASARAGWSSTSCSRSSKALPPGVEQGGTARVAFAVLDVARRSVAAGLVHPHLEAADGRWHALWGATLDDHVRAELDAIAHAAPAASAESFDGDTQAFVYDLYGCAVDELARRALRDAGVGLSVASRRGGGAAEHFLAGLAAPGPELACRAPATRRWNGGSPRGSTAGSHGARARRGTSGCASTRAKAGTRSAVPTRPRSCSSSGSRRRTTRPSPCPRRCSTTATTRCSRSSARATRAAPSSCRLGTIEPRPRRRGHRPRRRSAVAGGARRRNRSASFLRRAMPRLEELGVPVRLPARVGLVVEPRPRQPRRDRVAGDLQRAPDARRDRVLRLAARDRRRRAHRGGAARARGGEGAADPAARQVACASRAPRSSARSASSTAAARGAGVVELVRAVSGLETDEAGVELGEVTLDDGLDELLAGAGERRFRPLADARRDASRPLPVPGARPRLAPAARRSSGRRDPGRRHGPRQDRAGDRDARLRARGGRCRRSGRRSSSAR